jgi:hypothetical protein
MGWETRAGLVRDIGRRLPTFVVFVLVGLLVVANTINYFPGDNQQRCEVEGALLALIEISVDLKAGEKGRKRFDIIGLGRLLREPLSARQLPTCQSQ